MQRTTKTTTLVAAAMLAIGFAGGCAIGQAGAPTETKGQTSTPLKSLDLTEEIDTIKGRPLRMRKITLQPGGVLGLHTHKDRPAVSYILQGEIIYHQDGRETVARVGDGIAEGKSTTHWAENRGSVPAVWIAVDIPKEP